jgi:uncharacterized protein YdaT
MPWNKNDYPDSMKNLPGKIRNKAIEIANALLEEKNMDEGIAIATAISRAKDWGANRGQKTDNPEKSRITDVKKHGEDRYVIPHGAKEWAIRVEKGKSKIRSFNTKKEAINKARQEAKESNATLTIQSKAGKVQKRISYNPRKKAVKQS